MAQFSPAYLTYVKPIEGGYANVTGDKGGETYAGIARNFWASWPGWKVIDAYKAKGKIDRNTKFKELDAPVELFYNNMWNNNRFGEFKSQDVAAITYDWFVNSGSNAFNTKGVETYGLDEILVKFFGKNVPVDGKNDTATLNAANSVNAEQLFNTIKDQRKIYYDKLATDPTQTQFYAGWIKRLNAFAFSKSGMATLFFLLATGVVIWKWDDIKKIFV